MNTYGRWLVLCACLIFAYSLSAQTPDGETPSGEDVCDGLKAYGVTPGLYGLCNAYCEAQDCDSYADGAQPSSCDGLLTRYNERRSDSDPDMPCATASCPCWDAIVANGGHDLVPSIKFCTAGGTSPFILYTDGTPHPLGGFNSVGYALTADQSESSCNFIDDFNTDDSNNPDPIDIFINGLSPAQVEACREDIAENC